MVKIIKLWLKKTNAHYSQAIIMTTIQVTHFWLRYTNVLDARHLHPLPLKGDGALSPLFPSPTLIPPLIGKLGFPPRTPRLMGEGDVPISVLSPPPLMGKPLLPQRLLFTPQVPFIGRLTPLLPIRTSPHLLRPRYRFLHLFSSTSSYSPSNSSSNPSDTSVVSPFPLVESSNPPTPAPSSSPQTQFTSCTILQFNCNGILHWM